MKSRDFRVSLSLSENIRNSFFILFRFNRRKKVSNEDLKDQNNEFL
jgi:hypothetical protein